MADHELDPSDPYSIKLPVAELTAQYAGANVVLPDVKLSVQTKPAKAVVAFVIALAGAIGAGLVGDGSLSVDEIFAAISAAVVAAGGVYGITNKPV